MSPRRPIGGRGSSSSRRRSSEEIRRLKIDLGSMARLLESHDVHVRGTAVKCPAHDDEHASASIYVADDGDERLRCHACGFDEDVLGVAYLLGDLRDPAFAPSEGGPIMPPPRPATTQPGPSTFDSEDENADGQSGLTLEHYADAKQLPIEELADAGLSTITYMGDRALRIPYFGAGKELLSTRFRLALEGSDRFRWKKGSKPSLYGLDRVQEASDAGFVVIVEGESDTQTLWHHGLPALGLPGATAWKEDRDANHLSGIETIYIVIEPDMGGQRVLDWIARSAIRERVRLVHLEGANDPSELHLQDPAGFRERFQRALDASTPWREADAQMRDNARGQAWEACQELAQCPDVLSEFGAALTRAGLVGEESAAKLLHLAVTSRLLPRPVSVAVKGPSSGGKSFLVATVLSFFPEDAYYALTAMSERALAYSEEPLQHRMLVLYEAASLAGEWVSYLVRSLLSEGRVRYETVMKVGDGLKGVLIEREGPTGLIVTTTAVQLHPENETRLLNIAITDTREQTRAVLRSIATGHGGDEVDRSPWLALDAWLSNGPTDVVIPYAETLSELIPPVNIRLRRDFSALLGLISAHALLHQASRDHDPNGRVIATLHDYAQVRALVAAVIAEGIEAQVPSTVRETVTAIETLTSGSHVDGVTVTALARELRVDKSVASRRAKRAIELEFLTNLEEREHRPAQLVVGDPLPADLVVLPYPDRVEEALHGCVDEDGAERPPSPLRTDEGISAIAEAFPGLTVDDGQELES